MIERIAMTTQRSVRNERSFWLQIASRAMRIPSPIATVSRAIFSTTTSFRGAPATPASGRIRPVGPARGSGVGALPDFGVVRDEEDRVAAPVQLVEEREDLT